MNIKKEIIALKAILLILTIANTIFSLLFFPILTEFLIELKPELSFLQYPFLTVLFSTTVIILVISLNSYKLLSNIQNKSSMLNYIKKIKKLFYALILINIIISPLIYLIAEIDDAPGLILIHFIIITLISLFAFAFTLFEKITQKLA